MVRHRIPHEPQKVLKVEKGTVIKCPHCGRSHTLTHPKRQGERITHSLAYKCGEDIHVVQWKGTICEEVEIVDVNAYEQEKIDYKKRCREECRAREIAQLLKTCQA